MRAALALGALFVAAGCHAADPCAGKSGACLTVEATGSGIGALDQLLVTVTDGAGGLQTGGTGVVSPRITLPVQFAALLRDGTSGVVDVAVVGTVGGGAVAAGSASVAIPASGRARVTVALSSIGPPGDDMAGGGGGGGGGGGAPADMAQTGPSLTPPSLDLRVTAGQAGNAIYTVMTPIDVTLGATNIVPPTSGISISPSSTCQMGAPLAAGMTCSIVVIYSATKPESHTVQVQLTTNLGTAAASLRARSPGLVVETLAIGNPPTFRAVHAVDPVHVWAVGDNNVVYHRDDTGWHGLIGPGASATGWDSVWAASDDDVYIGSSGVFKMYRSTSRGQTWTSVDAGLTAGVEAIAGVDANTVYVASGQGEIAKGSAAGGFQNDGHPADGIAFDDLEVFTSNVFAARAGQIFLRSASGTPTWMTILDVSGVHFYATWGSTGTDVYAVGTLPAACTMNCGLLEHQVGGAPATMVTMPGCNAFYDVWGEALSPGFNVWAVGLNGNFVTAPDNDSWTALTTGTTAALYGVRGAGNEVYAVGASGTILHYVE